ncbi:uncharacterized protein LOC111332948 [Stylophora pistillata]|uniref:uncharacterized protein LOC111332948 n=1 Tax=Stylophora pistillata TaxID=50429 RepID=UPI000C04E170|nr:uncharacterized protein LOC111332948 [Stylophora pistillata]
MRVEIYGIPLKADNLALQKPTTQSSIYVGNMHNHWASNAVNGVWNFASYFCTRTRSSTNPWLGIDLEQVLPVSEVYILNSPETLDDAEIRVGNETTSGGANNSLCVSGLRNNGTMGKFFRSNTSLYGKYLFIRLLGSSKTLSLCEVEVFSEVMSNLALNQPAYQSSTLTNNTADKAVDGHIPTCSSTQSQQDPWWRVDLGATQVVAKVMVTYKNRTEGVHVWVEAVQTCAAEDSILPKDFKPFENYFTYIVFQDFLEILFSLKIQALTEHFPYAKCRFILRDKQTMVSNCCKYEVEVEVEH